MKQLEKNSLLIIAGLTLFTIMFGIGGTPMSPCMLRRLAR